MEKFDFELNNLISVIKRIEKIIDTTRVLIDIRGKAQHLLNSLHSHYFEKGKASSIHRLDEDDDYDHNDGEDQIIVRKNKNRSKIVPKLRPKNEREKKREKRK